MINVVIITPYPDLLDMAQAALQEYSTPGITCSVTHAYGTKVEDLALGKPDIILARGLTQLALKRKFADATVLEFSISAYDVLRAIHECRKTHGAEKIAVLGSDTIIYDVDALKEIINVDIRIFPIANETEIRDTLNTVMVEGFDAVVGGLTASTIADEIGFPSTFIKTSGESFRLAVKEAMNTAGVMFTERAKTEVTRAILQNSKEAILYFDTHGALMQYNRRANEVLSLSHNELVAGRDVSDVFPDCDLIELVRARTRRQGVLKTVNNNALVLDFKPVRLDGHDIGVICSCQRVHEIQDTESMIRKQLNKKGLVAKYGFANIIHSSPGLSETITTAHKYASVDANVLLIGETGTGKELFAQSIHAASPRRTRPFVAVNCAAFPENLLESELFGYAEGAFSGASKGGKTGLFELAHNGTLFLDEIGEIPMALQASLLRALQEREIRRIGDDKVLPVDVRIIAATNCDLRENVREGKFRMDLLYRLDVLSLFIPPLRSRKEDVRLIASYYIDHYCVRYNKPGVRLEDDAYDALEDHSWPGNTRELRNVCERLVVLFDDNTVVTREMVAGLLHVGSALPQQGVSTEAGTLAEPKGMEELVEFARSLRVNQSDIATMLGISRTTLWRRMKRLEGEK